MRKESFYILKVLGGIALFIPAVVGVIQIFGFLTTASSNLSATVETSSYQIHPKLESYIKKTFEEERKASGEPDLVDGSGESSFLSSGEDFSEVIFSLQFQSKYGASLSTQKFSTYKIVNSGDKAALDARLVNVVGSMAVIEGVKDPIEIKSKAAIELGRLDPRSTKLIFVWSRPYIDAQSESPFVQYEGGAIDVEELITVGGFYKHLHSYGMRYVSVLGAAFVFLISFVFTPLIRSSVTKGSDSPVSKAKRRRPRKRKPNQSTPLPESRD